MRVDNSTLQKMATELKVAVKIYLSTKNGSKIWECVHTYPKKYITFLLSRFDRYGVNVEYEKSGIRVANFKTGEIRLLKFGYPKNYEDCGNPTFDKIRRQHLGEMKPVKPNNSLVDMPSTESLIEDFRLVMAASIWSDKDPEEIEIYWKVKQLKPAMDFLAEKGYNTNNNNRIIEILDGLTVEQKNKVMSCFDYAHPGRHNRFFKGIRFFTKTNFGAIDKRGNSCRFMFNQLNLRPTKEIIKVWKEAIK